MRSKLIGIVLPLLALSACGDSFQMDQKKESKEAVKPKGPVRAGPEKINIPVEEAMEKIPPELRVSFQAALACEVRKAGGKGIEINASYVADLLSRLKANPALAKC